MCGQTTFVMTNNAEQFVWKNYGLKLNIRENSLPKGVEKCNVSIAASVAGQYKFSENFDLVSAVFWFRCKPVCKFTKSIRMEMEHCATLKNFAKLSFMKANCSQKRLPYTFKKIGGHFSPEHHCGSVELYGFSGVAAGQEVKRVTGTSNHDSSLCQREYGVWVFHSIHKNFTSYKIDFVVTWNTQAHITVSKESIYNSLDCINHSSAGCRTGL